MRSRILRKIGNYNEYDGEVLIKDGEPVKAILRHFKGHDGFNNPYDFMGYLFTNLMTYDTRFGCFRLCSAYLHPYTIDGVIAKAKEMNLKYEIVQK